MDIFSIAGFCTMDGCVMRRGTTYTHPNPHLHRFLWRRICVNTVFCIFAFVFGGKEVACLLLHILTVNTHSYFFSYYMLLFFSADLYFVFQSVPIFGVWGIFLADRTAIVAQSVFEHLSYPHLIKPFVGG